MIEKRLVLVDLEKHLSETTDENTKTVLEQIIRDIANKKYDIRIWE